MRSLRAVRSCVLLLLLTASSLDAATFLARPDEWMIRKAPAIVTGTVLETYSQRGERGIETVTRILVDEVLKGAARPGDVLPIVQAGGILEDSIEVMSGAPVYEVGKRYLVFAHLDRMNRWRTFDLAAGQFEFSRHNDRELLVRDESEMAGFWPSGEPYREPQRLARPFLAYVRSVIREEPSNEPYTLEGEAPRRFDPSADMVIAPQALDFDLTAASQLSVDKWNGAESSMNDSISGSAASGDTKDLNDSESRVIPDDPHNDIDFTFPGGTNVVATAFYGCNGGGSTACFTQSANGETYINIGKADIVVNDGVSSSTITLSNFRTAMVHEFGHTWGFRHSNTQPGSSSDCGAPLPCSSSAVMTSVIPNAINGVLQDWDLDGANEVYGNASREATFTGTQYVSKLGGTPARRFSNMSWRIVSAVCTGPTINTQPANKTIGGGQSTSLSVTATASSGSLTYQWYVGAKGDTSNPVGGGTTATINVTPSSTTSYWVRVKDGCAEVPNGKDSNAATVTVNCDPAITTQPSNKSITSGSSTTLSVTSAQATGFQWYDVTTSGVNTDESNPLSGKTTSSFSTGTLTETKKYWVKVSTNCGFTRSNVATVTVSAACNAPSISVQPASKSINSGTSTTLSVSASGTLPLTYQWYKASSPSATNPVGTNSATLDTGILTVTTNYWVKVTNSCPGTANSSTATVTVVSCTLPAITVQPLDSSITSGASATLAVTATGATTVTWYRGALGDKSQPVGVGSSINTGVLTETAIFWGALTNGCGETQTRQVTVTVAAACVAPAITVEPLSQTVPKNSSATISVVATGSAPLAYQWYEGFVLDTTLPVGAGSTLQTPILTKSTRYWVRISNACGTKDSAQVVITVPTQHRRAVRK